MTSPVPSTGSGTVSIASGDPSAFRTAAFMACSFVGGDGILAGFTTATRPGIILGLTDPPARPAMTDVLMNSRQSGLSERGELSRQGEPSRRGELSRQGELGDFLRSRREKLTPKGVGLPEGRRRRTPGLRREEVAELAGIGVDWYIRLEQGRTVSPSVTTIDALARALRLGKAEHKHLRALTENTDRRAFVPE